MPGRSALQRLLATLVGAILGAVIAGVVLAEGLDHWTLALLPVAGGVVGLVKGDRGIRTLARIVGSM